MTRAARALNISSQGSDFNSHLSYYKIFIAVLPELETQPFHFPILTVAVHGNGKYSNTEIYEKHQAKPKAPTARFIPVNLTEYL